MAITSITGSKIFYDVNVKQLCRQSMNVKYNYGKEKLNRKSPRNEITHPTRFISIFENPLWQRTKVIFLVCRFRC